VGRTLAGALHPGGLVGGAVVAVLAAILVVVLCAFWIWIGDRQAARLALAKLPWRPR